MFGKCTHCSTSMYNFSVTIEIMIRSYFPRKARPWNFLPKGWLFLTLKLELLVINFSTCFSFCLLFLVNPCLVVTTVQSCVKWIPIAKNLNSSSYLELRKCLVVKVCVLFSFGYFLNMILFRYWKRIKFL